MTFAGRGMVAVMMLGWVSGVACAELKTVPAPAPAIMTGSWAPALKEHPRLLGPRAFLKGLAKSKPQDYAAIRKLDKNVQAMGVVHAVEGLSLQQVEPFIATAMKHVARGPTNVHQDTWIWMQDVAYVYDLFHDRLTAEQRAKMIDWLNANLVSFTTDEGAFHNSTLSKINCYLRVACATWNENPKARDFRDHAIIKLYEGKVLPVILEFGEGGGFTECGWYTRHSLWHLIQGLELARRFENYDGLAKAPRFFYQRLAYEMLQPCPGLWVFGTERFAMEGDGSNVYGGHTEYPRHTRMVLGQYFRGSDLARLALNKRRKPSSPDARLVDFLCEEPPEKPLPIEQMPLAHLASGIGKLYARSDWSDSATWLRFECGDFWNMHQHYEVGNFEIFRYEPLATESGEYTDYMNPHAVNWLIRTIAHNCILVNQPGETWARQRDGGRNHYANDGGQRNRFQWVAGDLNAWKAKRQDFEMGEIVAYRNDPEFMYVAGDCSAAYSKEKLSQWVRQIVFLRPHTIVMFDRVVSTRPQYDKTWLLHCRPEPAIEGSQSTIVEGKGRLVTRTLLPEHAKIQKIHGYTYGGQTFEAPRSGLTNNAAKWRIEVAPASPATEDLFLHVMFTDREEPTQLIKTKGGVGVQVGSKQVMFTGPVGVTLRGSGPEVVLKRQVVRGDWE